MAVDIPTVPPFIVFQKPLFRFSPNVSRVYVDEVSNDVVIISASASEVAFFHLSLRDGEGAGDASAKAVTADVPDVSWLRYHPYLPSDGIALTVKGRQIDGVIRHAKRCPTPVRDKDGSRAHLVALSYNSHSVFFFLCQRCTGSLPLSAVATFQCSPRNLRFREEHYPIQVFFWIAGHEMESEAQKQEEQHQQREDAYVSNNSSWVRSPHQPDHENFPSLQPSSSTRRTIMCITSISIDLVAIDEVMPRTFSSSRNDNVASNRTWVLLYRYPTHTDYWHYNPASRILLSINKHKPTVVKLFEASKESLHPLRKVFLGESCLAAKEEKAKGRMPFYSSASMDAPVFYGSIGTLTLNRRLFLCFIQPSDGCAVVYRYAKVDANGIALEGAEFVRYATLQADFRLNPFHDPIALQVIDNLVVLHALERKITCCFDIICNAEPTTFASQLQSDSSGTVLKASGASSDIYLSPSYISPSVILGCNSWIASLANGIRRNSGVFSQKNNSEKGVNVTTGPIFRPILSASLALYSMSVDATPATTSMCDAVYEYDFINTRSLPLALDLKSGNVCLTYVNPFATAAAMPHGVERMQFYLNRLYCAGSAVPSILRAMLTLQEDITAVSQCFAAVVMHDARQRTLIDPTSSSVPSSTCFERSPKPCVAVADFLGSTLVLRRALCAVDGDGSPFPQRPPWRAWGGLTRRDIFAVCTATGRPGAGGGQQQLKEGAGFNKSIGQMVIQRCVFAPLTNAVLPSSSSGGGGDDDDGDDAKKSVDAYTTATRFFARYLYYAILEYGRCVMHTGDTLTEGIQRLLLRLLPVAALGHQGMHQLLLPGLITDTVPMALRLLRMSTEYRQMAFDMLKRLRADTVLVQEFLAERRPLDAARQALLSDHCDAQVLGAVLCVAMDMAREKGTTGALEFVAVYEMITGWLLNGPMTPETVPAELVPATAEYERMLMKCKQTD